MVTIETFRQLALSFPDVEEKLHFHMPSFRIKGKQIFATIHEKDARVMLRLPPVEQSVYCDYDNTIFFPVPGSWGAQGATLVELKKVKKSVLREAMDVAYTFIAGKK